MEIFMKVIYKQVAALTIAFATLGAGSAFAAKKELNVAYFLEWPTANQVAQLEKTYDEKMGVKVNWKAFDNGNAMTAAMLSGDIDVAYSQGFVPFVVAVSKGVDLKMVGVAVTYSENDNCVVHKDSGITKANAKELEGKKVGTPTGNVTHYKLLQTLKHLGVDASKVRILSMSNSDVSAALARGDVTMACGFGGSLNRMKKYGDVLLTGAEQEAIGLKVFDIVTVPGSFAKEHPEMVQQFMQITEDANRAYLANPGKYYDIIAKAAGMSKKDTADTLSKFGFPSRDAQLSTAWMGGDIQKFTKGVADVLVQEKQMPKALSQAEYSKAVDSSYLKNIK